jgi:single-strand DNA-binding protein
VQKKKEKTMNKLILLGRLVHDPEMRVTPQTNTSVVRFSLAVNRAFKAAEGQPTADFFNIVAWKSTADFVNKYFKKGQQVLIEGSLRNKNWTDKDGNKRYSTEVHADHVYFADSKRDQSASTSSEVPNTQTNTQTGDGFYTMSSDDEDLPF